MAEGEEHIARRSSSYLVVGALFWPADGQGTIVPCTMYRRVGIVDAPQVR